MSFIFEQPLTPPPAGEAFAGGEASLSDIWASARDAAIYNDNVNAEFMAVEEAYNRRIAAVFKATGQRLSNPVLDRHGNRERKFAAQLSQLQAQYPDKARDIRAQVPIDMDARQLANEAGRRFETAMGNRSGFWGKWSAALGGSFAGSLRDPLQVGTLFVGGGAGAGRSTATRILSAALKEAAVNGAVEAAMQPRVQAWRKEIGLDSGFDEGLRNTLFAAGFAGVLGGAGQGVSEVVARMIGTLPPGAPARRGLEGGPDELAKILDPVADTLDPAARGALAEIEADTAITLARPAAVPPETHDARFTAALRAAEDDGPIVEIDMTKPRRQWNDRPANVMEAIAAMGGLRDDAGELAARGLDFRNTMTKFGPAYRKQGEDVGAGGGLFGDAPRRQGKGLPPSDVLERLQQEGFFPGRDLGNLTEEDLYKLIDDHIAGKTVVAEKDRAWQAQVEADNQTRATADELDNRFDPHEAQFIRDHGYQMFDELKQAEIDIRGIRPEDASVASRLMAEQGLDAGAALERAALMAMDNDIARLADGGELSDIPFDEVPHGTDGRGLQGDGGTFPPDRGQDLFRGRAGDVRDQRRPRRNAGQAQGRAGEAKQPVEVAPDRPPPPDGGIDDPFDAAAMAEVDKGVAVIEADEKQLSRQILFETADGERRRMSLGQALDEARRSGDLAQLAEACKVM